MLYSPTSPSYNVREERGITPTYSPPASDALCDPRGCGSPLPSYSPMSRSVSPRPRYANLLDARATGRYSPTAPTYSQTFADAGTSYLQQPTANDEEAPEAEPVAKKPTVIEEEPKHDAEKPTVIEEEPKHDAKKPKAAEPRQILTRAVHSQQKAEKELLQINAEIERLNKRKAELEANDRAHKKRA